MNKNYLLLFILLCTYNLFGQTVVFSNSRSSRGLALHKSLDSLFIASASDNKIYVVGLDDPNYKSNAVLSTTDSPRGIALKDDELYISLNRNGSSLDKIVKINVKETNPILTEVSTVIAEPNGLTIYNNILYVSAKKNIYTIDLLLENSTPYLLIDDLSTVFGTIGLCVWNNYLYVSDTWENQLVKYNLNTSNPNKEVVLSNFNGNGLSVLHDKIYTSSFSGNGFPATVYEIDPISETINEIGNGTIGATWDVVVSDNSLYASNSEGGEVVRYNFNALSVRKFDEQHFTIYPNPSSNYINLNTLGNIGEIKIYDFNGRLVKTSGAFNKQINIEELAIGTYLLKSNNGFIGKFLKK